MAFIYYVRYDCLLNPTWSTVFGDDRVVGWIVLGLLIHLVLHLGEFCLAQWRAIISPQAEDVHQGHPTQVLKVLIRHFGRTAVLDETVDLQRFAPVAGRLLARPLHSESFQQYPSIVDNTQPTRVHTRPNNLAGFVPRPVGRWLMLHGDLHPD